MVDLVQNWTNSEVSDAFYYDRYAPVAKSGWLNGYEYILYGHEGPAVFQVPTDPDEFNAWKLMARERIQGVYIQFIMSCTVFWIFFHNSRTAAKELYVRYRSLPAWCIAIQSFLGIIYGVWLAYGFLLPGGPSCRTSTDFTITSLAISTLCMNTTLLIKAYAVHQRNKLLLYTGILAMLPSPPAIIYVITMQTPAVITPAGGCVTKYPPYFPWLKFGLEVPVNVLFSVAFIIVEDTST
jgi:hypothetical protein